MSKSSRINLYDSSNFSQLFEIKNELDKVSFNSVGDTEINATAMKFIKKDSQGNVVDSIVDVVSFINNLDLRLNNITLKIDSVFPNATPVVVIPNFITPHNLTSSSSNADFIVNQSSVFYGDIGNYGGWRCFDDQVYDSNWSSHINTYSNGIQTTGIIAPMPTAGSWIYAVFGSDHIITKLRYKAGSSNIPADFTVARFDGTNWYDSGFSITNASQTSGTYLEYTIPSANGGGGMWKGIALIVSRTHAWDSNSCVTIVEIDFQ